MLDKFIGTGPYMVDEWKRGESIKMVKFDDYWGEPAVNDGYILRWAKEGTTRLLELQAGTADWITTPNIDDWETIQEDDTIIKQNTTSSETTIKLLVDCISVQLLQGAEIDYTSGIQEQFIIRNPNAKTTCGCGSSFSVDDD